MFTELDIAYTAGLVDGEGSLVLFKDKRQSRSINCHVTMNMVDKETIDHVAAVFRHLSGDRCMVRIKDPLSGFSRRRQYVVDVSSKAGCLRTLLALQPYLVTKRLQADLIISILRRAVDVRNYPCSDLDLAMMRTVKRLKGKECGEARADAVDMLHGQVTPSQTILRLAPLASDRMAGVETRTVTRKNNRSHERPAPQGVLSLGDEDIVQPPDESPGSGLNSPTKSVN